MEYCFNYCKPSIYITGAALPHFRGVLHLIVTLLHEYSKSQKF